MKNHKNILGPNIIDNVTRGPEYSESDVTWTNAKTNFDQGVYARNQYF